ncbi:hypothetical protein PG997_005546 [Apiospora hydei]|uniref:Uncharacterized protein n=1 Tax=Apiospora hydei TaxID=1337664 RepID=A0ABR1WP58_9PEZI
MASQRTSSDTSQPDSIEWEKEGLLIGEGLQGRYRSAPWLYSKTHIVISYTLNAVLLSLVAILAIRQARSPRGDASVGVYCKTSAPGSCFYNCRDMTNLRFQLAPANEAIEYIPQHKFQSALFSHTPYMGYPTDETDQLWKDLYNDVAISTISEDEAKLLPHPTLPIPGTNRYLVQLDVFHELHCLDDLRMLLYPERFPGMDELKDENGIIDRTTHAFRHWDHCIDALRQALMCHADVSPISWRLNVPVKKMLIPQLSTTHTCRNFSRVHEWAQQHRAGAWNYNVTADMAEEIIRTSGFDQAPDEDIEDQYENFPGDPFFRYWREHPDEAKVAVQEVQAARAKAKAETESAGRNTRP